VFGLGTKWGGMVPSHYFRLGSTPFRVWLDGLGPLLLAAPSVALAPPHVALPRAMPVLGCTAPPPSRATTPPAALTWPHTALVPPQAAPPPRQERRSNTIQEGWNGPPILVGSNNLRIEQIFLSGLNATHVNSKPNVRRTYPNPLRPTN